MLPTEVSRRVFLKGLSVCSATLALSGLSLPAQAARAAGWTRNLHDETRLLMDTVVRITVSRASRDQAAAGMALAFAEMERLIAIFDRHHAGTVLTELNTSRRLADAPAELVAVLEEAQRYNRMTAHAFDITVQPVLDLLASHSNPRGSLRIDQADMRAALALVGMDGVHVRGSQVSLAREGMGVTLDGIAKGYIVDVAARTLEAQGLTHYLINAGGDIRCSGEKRSGTGWVVAVEDPAGQGGYPAVLTMRGGAIATSGVYERYFDKQCESNHLLFPQTGASPKDCLSVTVKAPTTMQADSLATALSVMPRNAALQLVNSLPDCACLFVLRDGKQVPSDSWQRV